MSNKKQVKPKWFNGEIYSKGATVINPFSREEYELNNVELSIYDFIIGANRTLEILYDERVEPNDKINELIKDLHKGLDWFKEHNAEAYMVLLD
tara:strand:+ start:557 stop:838 length:282 start_codon:yes stop_codon:yes gene_type:complete